MKNKKILILLLTFMLISCFDSNFDFDEGPFDGFMISVANSTNQIYQGEIVVGGFKNNKFMATDSIRFERNLVIGSATGGFHFVNENRWKPDLIKIKNIPSERCYFKLKLSDNREELITEFQSSELFSLALPVKPQFEGRFGQLLISFDSNNIWGDVAERID